MLRQQRKASIIQASRAFDALGVHFICWVLWSHRRVRLDVELCLLALGEHGLQLSVRKRGLYPLGEELVDLLWRAAGEGARVEQRVELALDRVEVRVRAHALDEVVVEPELLDLVRGLVRQDLQSAPVAFVSHWSEV